MPFHLASMLRGIYWQICDQACQSLIFKTTFLTTDNKSVGYVRTQKEESSGELPWSEIRQKFYSCVKKYSPWVIHHLKYARSGLLSQFPWNFGLSSVRLLWMGLRASLGRHVVNLLIRRGFDWWLRVTKITGEREREKRRTFSPSRPLNQNVSYRVFVSASMVWPTFGKKVFCLPLVRYRILCLSHTAKKRLCLNDHFTISKASKFVAWRSYVFQKGRSTDFEAWKSWNIFGLRVFAAWHILLLFWWQYDIPLGRSLIHCNWHASILLRT